MPIVDVHILEGYAPADKSRLASNVTDAVCRVVPAAGDAVTVLIHELPEANYMRGGEHRSPAAALPDPAAIIRLFLEAMERRDIDAAEAMLADDFQMQFPDTAPMRALTELLEWAALRYRFVKKTYSAFDTSGGGDGTSVVHCHGTLSGEWPDGTPFEGIRFIDRFEIRNAKISRQDVWNDIAEYKANR